MSFTENLYLRKQLQKLQEENSILKQILEQSLPNDDLPPFQGFKDGVFDMDQEDMDMRVRRLANHPGPLPVPKYDYSIDKKDWERIIKPLIDDMNRPLTPKEKLMNVVSNSVEDFKDMSTHVGNRLRKSALSKGAAGLGAGIVGDLAGEYIVKPAAEKAGVFDAVGKASKAAFERMPPAAVDAADKALGAAQYVLSGGPVSDTVSAVADAISASNKKQAEKEVNRAKSGNLGPRPGPKF